MLSERQKKLLKMLINVEEPLNGRVLATKMGVSDRTIRSDIISFNADIEDSFGVTGVYSSRAGYLLNQNIKDNILEMLKESNDIPDTSELRMLYILIQLLWSNYTVTAEDIANNIFCSRTTVANLFHEADEHYIAPSGLKMISDKTGTKILGSESNKRQMLNKVLRDVYENGSIVNARSIFENMSIIDGHSFLLVYDNLIEQTDRISTVLTDQSLYLFTMEILISANRINLSYAIEDSWSTCIKASGLDYSFAEKVLNVSYPSKDIAWMDERFSALRKISEIKNEREDKADKEIIDSFLNNLVKNWKISQEALEMNRNSLISHLKAMIHRLSLNEQADSMMSDEIKLEYPYAFECASSIIPLIETFLNRRVTEGEISYIAVHIAVILENMKIKKNVIIICGSGMGSALLIQRRLEEFFASSVNIIETGPSYRLPMMLNKHPETDLVLSTILIEDKYSKPIIQISPVFNKFDIEKIKHYLEINEVDTKYPIENTSILNESLFYVASENDEKWDIVQHLTSLLYKNDCISDSAEFYASVKKRESMYSTKYERIWIPHPLTPLSKKSAIAVSVLKKDQQIDVIFLLAVRPDEIDMVQGIYDKILDLLDYPEKLNELKTASDFAKFITIFNS